ncbi:hypothetical protein B0H67DRAFT_318005 [Lasiosphaeris hirsuta]|uniref:Uncharacterized protein n=1 Tax=Lasiosphaeris hirsuta TaxID=260670 RepID=A0AA40A1J8_9PEZI|nr:hypothetical protein B0H67DRAFT_318005 [Lasiosphaeris hirsuta]
MRHVPRVPSAHNTGEVHRRGCSHILNLILVIGVAAPSPPERMRNAQDGMSLCKALLGPSEPASADLWEEEHIRSIVSTPCVAALVDRLVICSYLCPARVRHFAIAACEAHLSHTPPIQPVRLTYGEHSKVPFRFTYLVVRNSRTLGPQERYKSSTGFQPTTCLVPPPDSSQSVHHHIHPISPHLSLLPFVYHTASPGYHSTP